MLFWHIMCCTNKEDRKKGTKIIYFWGECPEYNQKQINLHIIR